MAQPPPFTAEEGKENVKKILLIARRITAENIKKAEPGEAILIANRVAQYEQFFRDRGVVLEENEPA